MHAHDLRPFEHSHAFGDAGAAARARALWLVTWLTLVTMVGELAAGWWSGSMALTADGWHMGTHAAALGGAALAAHWARRADAHGAFAFGGWKIEMLAAYSSGLLLAAVSLWLVVDALSVLREPRPIAYAEAMTVAAVGLAVNLASVWLLEHGRRDGARAHDDRHARDHAHSHGHAHDHNFGAAYLHVLADAVTSVLAIAALAGGWWLGWSWLDPAVALLAAVVIARWAWGVVRHATRALVDATADEAMRSRVRAAIEGDGDARLSDLHVWQVGARSWAAAVSLVADRPLDAAAYRQRLLAIDTLQHVTVEVHRCRAAHGAAGPT